MGCGRVGSTLARSLEDRHHTVSVIDSEPDSFRRLGPWFNGDKVTGYGFDQEVLEKAETGVLRAAGGGKDEGEAALREVLDMMACKAAVKAGDRMSELELAELVKLRGEVERSSNCPHGRPTSVRLTIKELEKLFGRT